MLIFHKPRCHMSGWEVEETTKEIKPVWAYVDVFWAGDHGGICIAKGNHMIQGVFVLAPDETVAEELSLTSENTYFYHYKAPTTRSVFATLLIVFSDGTSAMEENVEDLSVVWMVRSEKNLHGETKVSHAVLDSESKNVGLPMSAEKQDVARTHLAFVKGSMDAIDVIQMVGKPGFVPSNLGVDENLYIILMDWRTELPKEAGMEIYSNTLSIALESCQ